MAKPLDLWLDSNRFDSSVYRDGRLDYPLEFFESIVGYLSKTSPIPDETVAYSIGCGPGKGHLGLSKTFTKVFASDPSPLQLAQCPQLENVTNETYTSDEVIAHHEAHKADFCFFGLSLQFCGVKGGNMCAKYLLKKNSPSIMSASGYHFGYILEPSSVPKEAIETFEKVEKGEIKQIITGINKCPIYYEDITSFYPDYTHKSLYMAYHYPAHEEASSYMNKLTDILGKSPLRDSEFMDEDMDFNYTKKCYFHSIEKTTIANVFKTIVAWSFAIKEEHLEEYKQYCNEFSEKLAKILKVTDPDEPIYAGRIFYNYLCSDNIDLHST